MENSIMHPLSSFTDFQKIHIYSGTIVQAEGFPKARSPAFKIWVDFGEKIGILKTSAQITNLYTLETLVGKQVMGCVNLGEKNIAGFQSQFLLLGFSDEKGHISLASPDHKVPNGQRLH